MANLSTYSLMDAVPCSDVPKRCFPIPHSGKSPKMCLSQLSVSDVHTAACRAKAHHAADRSAIALLLRVPPLHKMATAEQMEQPGGGLLPQLSLIKSRL